MRTFLRLTFLSVTTSAGLICIASAQSVDPQKMVNPPDDAWLTYHGDYNGQRHSKLTQITPANIATLKQAWRFQTTGNQAIKASPILVDGVLYITTPDNL